LLTINRFNVDTVLNFVQITNLEDNLLYTFLFSIIVTPFTLI